MIENDLWQGWVETAIAAVEGLKNQQARNFQQYRQKHRHRIPYDKQYQQLGIPIGSGDVETSFHLLPFKQNQGQVSLPLKSQID
jgi:hypothetical protein